MSLASSSAAGAVNARQVRAHEGWRGEPQARTAHLLEHAVREQQLCGAVGIELRQHVGHPHQKGVEDDVGERVPRGDHDGRTKYCVDSGKSLEHAFAPGPAD